MSPAEIYVAFGGALALAWAGVATAKAACALRLRWAFRRGARPCAPWDHTAHDALDPPTPSLTSPPSAKVSLSGAHEVSMSDLSTIKNEFMSFLAKLDGLVPVAAQPAIQEAASTVHAAIAQTEATLVSTAETAAPTVLSSVISKDVPAEFQPLASLALQLGIAALTAKAGL